MKWLTNQLLRCAAVVLAASVSTVGLVQQPAWSAVAPSCGPSRSDQLTETPWPLRLMRPDLAWPISQGAGVRVAVIDSGVSATHPALVDKVLAGRDFIDPSAKGQCDEAAHGTLVAGVIAGRQPEGSAFTGMAPKASILPVRVLRDTQRDFDPNTSSNIAAAIRWSVDNGADVINLSLTTEPTPALESAVQYALDRNVVVVAAAGNDGGSDGSGKPAYPAAYDGVIAVAGVDEQGHHVNTSTSGSYVDVAAPGADVDGPMPRGGGYARFEAGGTSFAAAYVSGLAALIRATNWELTPEQIAGRIKMTADHPPEGRNDEVGFGVINPYRALAVVSGGVKPPPPAAALDPPTAAKDPMAEVRNLAAWTAASLAGTAAVIALAAAIVRRARRRDDTLEQAGVTSSPSRAAQGVKPARSAASGPGTHSTQGAPRRTQRPATARQGDVGRRGGPEQGRSATRAGLTGTLASREVPARHGDAIRGPQRPSGSSGPGHMPGAGAGATYTGQVPYPPRGRR